MPHTFPKTIEEAAQLLDKVISDWYKKIDINILDMETSERCILGQLYNSYGYGILELFGDTVDYQYAIGDTIFGIRVPKSDWIKEIVKRKEPPHDFSWALTQLKAGKLVCLKEWTNGAHIKWKDEKIYWDTGLEVSGDSLKDFLNFNHFEIYATPKTCIKDLKPGDKFTFYKGGPQFTVVALENNTTSKVFYIGQDHFVAGTRCSKEVIKC